MTKSYRARATAAAPLYFKPFVKCKTGTVYTDGAIHYNCPAWVADHERRVLWEDVRNRDPDIFLSFGTGLSTQPATQSADIAAEIPKAERAHQKRSTSGFTLMWRTALGIIDSQLNCEKAWNDYLGKISSRTDPVLAAEARRRHMRINVQLNGSRPRLDQVDQIEALGDQALYSARGNPDIREIAHRLVASSFYFESLGGFHQEHGTYSCQGKQCSTGTLILLSAACLC